MIEISNNVRIYASEKTFSRLLIPFPRIGLKEKMGVSWSAESIADHQLVRAIEPSGLKKEMQLLSQVAASAIS